MSTQSEIIFESFNISENNTISVESAKVLGYVYTLWVIWNAIAYHIDAYQTWANQLIVSN